MAGEQSSYAATGDPIIITDTYMYEIADAIRAKTGNLDRYTPAQMASAIRAIETGGSSSSSDAFITAMETNEALGYPGRYQYSRIAYSSSSTNYLLGVYKEYESFTNCRDGLISHPFVLLAKYSSNYYVFIYTPTVWAYTLAKNYNYWAPTYAYIYGTSIGTSPTSPTNIWVASSSQLTKNMVRPLLNPTTSTLCFATQEVLGSAAVPKSAKSNTTPTVYNNPHLWLYNKAPQDEYTTTTEPNKRWLYGPQYIYFLGWEPGSV